VPLTSPTDAPGPAGPRPRFAEPRPLVVALPALALFAWWGLADGGAAPGAWYPGALALLAALVAVLLARGVPRLGPSGRLALGSLAAFTGWSLASIAWADARGDAWDEANRALLYLVVFTLFAVLPWRARDATRLVGAFALVVAALGVWTLAGAIGGDAQAFREGRLAGPVGYENASAALFLTAYWAALVLAADRRRAPLARGGLLAAAGVLLQLVVLAQSRGSLLAAAVALVAALLLAPERRRLLLALTATVVTTLPMLPVLLRPFTAVDPHRALVASAVVVAVGAAALFAAGTAARRLDHWPSHPAGFAAATRWLAVGAAVTIAAAFLASTLDARFAAGAGTGRYDFWRVSLRQLAAHPLNGAGAGNFAHDHDREPERHEQPLYPHSILFGTLGQLGLVGASLLSGFLLGGFAGGRRVNDAAGRAAVAAALVAVAAWLAQASIDWLWELPGVTAPVIALLGLVAALGREPVSPRRRLAIVAPAVVAAASLAFPALAARGVERAARTGSIAAADRASDLNPLSNRAATVAGVLALRAGDGATARREFREAVARDGHDWYAQLQLGLLTRDDARIGLARRLNPSEAEFADPQRLAAIAIPGPTRRHGIDCRPVLGIGLGPGCERGGR
jgi:O-Antigen ligase